MTKDLTTSFHFLCRNDLWKREKPYSLKFIPKADFPKNNGQRAQKDGILVEDIRGRESNFSFEKNGFAIMRIDDSRMTYSDFDNPDIINAIYLKQIAHGLQELLGAERVQIFDCLVLFMGNHTFGRSYVNSTTAPECEKTLLNRQWQQLASLPAVLQT